MRILCLLQNAWGGRVHTTIFKPNPLNKSAKVMRKVCGPRTVMHFCNTTGIHSFTAQGKLPIDHAHMEKVIAAMQGYNIILVCGKQAEQAYEHHKQKFLALGKPIVVVMHPAARTLTNSLINRVRCYIERVPLKKHSYAKMVDWQNK